MSYSVSTIEGIGRRQLARRRVLRWKRPDRRAGGGGGTAHRSTGAMRVRTEVWKRRARDDDPPPGSSHGARPEARPCRRWTLPSPARSACTSGGAKGARARVGAQPFIELFRIRVRGNSTPFRSGTSLLTCESSSWPPLEGAVSSPGRRPAGSDIQAGVRSGVRAPRQW
jgi:hypothetical protein